ncbi:MAG TPA: hypothetical protein VIM66_02730 [Candidatus Limnocylindria bacterium]
MAPINRSSARGGARLPAQDLAVASIARQVARLPPERRAELEAYLRAAGQRCWVCNGPDSEPVRLQQRVDRRWVASGTIQLCSACLMALCTPVLVRRLGIGRWVQEAAAAPGRPAAPGSTTLGSSAAPADVDDQEPPPLELIKGA